MIEVTFTRRIYLTDGEAKELAHEYLKGDMAQELRLSLVEEQTARYLRTEVPTPIQSEHEVNQFFDRERVAFSTVYRRKV